MTGQVKGILFDCFGVLYVQAYRLRSMQRNQQLLDLSQNLRKHYKVGLLSNMSESTMERYFDRLERQNLFDVVVLSGDVGVPKPHPDIFHTAVDRLGLTPGETLFIDDDTSNVLSARSLGIQAICYENNASLLKSLREAGVEIG